MRRGADMMMREDLRNMTAAQTLVKKAGAMEWSLMPDHVSLYHREIVTASEADALGVRVSSVLWEKIGVG